MRTPSACLSERHPAQHLRYFARQVDRTTAEEGRRSRQFIGANICDTTYPEAEKQETSFYCSVRCEKMWRNHGYHRTRYGVGRMAFNVVQSNIRYCDDE